MIGNLKTHGATADNHQTLMTFTIRGASTHNKKSCPLVRGISLGSANSNTAL